MAATKGLVNAARIAKMDVMDAMIRMAKDENEDVAVLLASKAKMDAMSDDEWLKYHGVR